MTQGEDPSLDAKPGIGEKWVPQPRREDAPPLPPVPPETSPASGADGDGGDDHDVHNDRAESDRRRHNQSVNRAFVIGVIKILPPTVAVDDGWTGDAIALGYYPWFRRRAGRVMARAVMQRWTIWKLHDSVGPSNQQTVMKSGEPRWIAGGRRSEKVPGSRDFLVAKRDPNDDVSLRVVRVAADAYDTFRSLGQRDLRDGFRFRRQYNKDMYDRTRNIVRVTARLRGVVRIFDAYNRDDLQPRPDDVAQRRLPAEHVRLVLRYTDGFMDAFEVERHLREMTDGLGLRDAYMRLKAVHKQKWRPPIGAGTTE